MKKFVWLSAITISLLLAFNIHAQQWSAEQKEVWAGVEAYWAVGMSVDFINYFDDSYSGWNYEIETPHTKADAQKYINYRTNKGKRAYYIITPAKIWVNGNFAYVHYYYTEVTEGLDGKPITENGRWTDILMKKDGKWIMVGDHGGKTSK